MDLKQIQELIKLANKGELRELKIEDGDFRVIIKTKYAAPDAVVQTVQHAPVAASAAVAPVSETKEEKPATQPAAPAADDSKLITIKSPMIGTFYRSAGPDKEPFVKIGDNIDKGSVLCIVEAMKLFNEIESEVSGKIVKVLLDDASPVEYDQPLFVVDPS